MLNAEKEKQRLLEERWALSVNRKATSEAEGAGNTVRRGSFKGVIDGSKAVFLFDDGVKQPLKSTNTKQKQPPSATKPNNQHSYHSSKNS